MALLRRAYRRLLFILSVTLNRPTPVRLHRGEGHLFPAQGIVLPVIAGGAPDDPPADPDDPKQDPEPSDPPADPSDPPSEPEPDPDPDDPAKVTPKDDWKSKSRKNETRAKRAERELKEEREKREELEEKDRSESEKAISAAEKKGREEAAAEAAEERQADRLEVAVTRLASKKIKVGEGDEAKEYRFADIEDALIHIERAISKGEIEKEEIFDEDGRVKADALHDELAGLLARKPHLRESGSEGSGERPKGDPDTRKGAPAKTDLESLSPDDHAKRKYGESK